MLTLDEIRLKVKEIEEFYDHYIRRYNDFLGLMEERDGGKDEKHPLVYLTPREVKELYEILVHLEPIVTFADPVYENDYCRERFSTIANDVAALVQKPPFYITRAERIDRFLLMGIIKHQCSHHVPRKCSGDTIEVCINERCIGWWGMGNNKEKSRELLKDYEEQVILKGINRD